MNHKLRLLAFIMSAVMLISSMSMTAFASEYDFADVSADAAAVETGDPAVVITGADNTATGTRISWSAADGASTYGIYLRDGSRYTLLAQTAELSYTHAPLENGREYIYSVRAVNRNGEVFAQSADYSNTFYAPPVISSLTAVDNGVKIVWGATEGVEAYRLYRAAGSSGWSRLALVNGSEYIDSTAESGKIYTYTVRCVTPDGERFLSYHNEGKTFGYVKTPAITSFSNTLTGTRISFDKPEGVAKIRVYYRGENGWNRIGETSDTSIVHDNLTGGTTYKYTVRGVDGNGDFVTDFNTDGWDNMFIEPPVITSLDNTDEGIVINWRACAGAEKYRIYYYGSKGWTKMAETTETSFLDTDVRSGYHYTYTVRCITPDSTGFTSYHNSGAKTLYMAQPAVTSFNNTVTGTTIKWNAPSGDYSTRVYVRGDSGWTRLTQTSSDSYTHDNLTPGYHYTYTLRCVDGNGDFVTGFNSEGWTNTFIEPPVITSLDCLENGIQISWKPCEGAEKYRIYYYGSKGWTKMAETTETTFLDTDVRSGNHYTYTVRCISADSSRFTSSHNSGKKVLYITPPVISSIENTDEGAKITWEKVNGADFYRIYYKNNDGGWTRLASKYLTEYTDTSVADGETRTYTIRCLNEDGDFVSGFNTEGWSNTYFAAPEVSSVSYDGSYTVEWQGREGVASYRLYRRTLGSSWSRLFDSTKETRYTDNDVQSDKIYAYTLRYMDADGNLISGYLDKVRYYKNGKPVSGNIYDNGTYGFEDGYPLIGLNRVDGYLRYYNSQGRMYRDTVVGNSSVGYYYTDPDGICIESEEMRLAAEFIEKYCKGETMKEKMKYAFLYMAENYPYERVYDDTPSSAADIPPFAIELFSLHKGTCYRYAAAYACVAKIAGYRTRFAYGMSGVLQHGWTEVYVDGSWLICDVDAQLPGYGYEDYAPYMMSTHMWVLDKYWYSELTLKNGKAVWTPIQYF